MRKQAGFLEDVADRSIMWPEKRTAQVLPNFFTEAELARQTAKAGNTAKNGALTRTRRSQKGCNTMQWSFKGNIECEFPQIPFELNADLRRGLRHARRAIRFSSSMTDRITTKEKKSIPPARTWACTHCKEAT